MIHNQAILYILLPLIGALAVVGLYSPFWGLIVFVIIHYIQPAELVPSLAPLRPELVYGVLLLGSVVLHSNATPARKPSNNILGGAVFLVVVAACSVPFSVWKGDALSHTIILVKLVTLLFLLGRVIDTSDRLRRMLWVIIALLGWFSATSLISYLQGGFIVRMGIERSVGITSIGGDPNALAGLIASLLPFGIAGLRCSRGFLARLAIFSMLGVALAAVVVTGSRAGMVGLLALTAYYIIHARHRIALLVCSLILAAAVWSAMPAQYQQRYLTTVEYAEGNQLDASNQLRIQIWKAGWKMFLDYPVLGVGAGQFPTAYGSLKYSGVAHGPWMQPHSLFIQVASELGLVGLIAFGYFVIQIVTSNRALLRLPQENMSEGNREVAIACEGMLVVALAVSCFGHTFYSQYWYLAGGLIAANRKLMETRFESEAAIPSADRLEESDEQFEDVNAIFERGRVQE